LHFLDSEIEVLREHDPLILLEAIQFVKQFRMNSDIYNDHIITKKKEYSEETPNVKLN
jgi:hypothetical protein